MNAETTAPLKGRRILVLEDEFFISLGIEKSLYQAGAVEVAVASTIKDAWEKTDGVEFDMAILDIHVPDGEPTELARFLVGAGTGVLFHSGHAEESVAAAVPNARFCSKPSEPDDLVQALVSSVQTS